MSSDTEKLKVRITATSYLLPGARGWRPLSARHTLEFGEYGDWSQVLLESDPQLPIVWLVFLDDVLPEESLERLGLHEAFDAHAVPLLSLLEARLAGSTGPTIVGWLTPRRPPIAALARRRSLAVEFGSRFQDALYDLAERFSTLHIVSLDQALAPIGRARALDPRNFYAAHCRLSAEGVAVVASALLEVFDRLRQPACKVLVLDCDNTLWGGVVGEDGVAGLRLGEDGEGAAFADFQRVIRRLATEGLVLALCSKNNEADAWEVFERHSGMILKREQISAWRIDWNEKAHNIAEISEELGVGLASVAFWDDNPLEREKVKAALPEVRVLDVPESVVEWPARLASAPEFANFEITADDRSKSAQYRARGAFVREALGQTDRRAFLKSIALQPEAVPLDASLLGRAAQLCAKTNQFNARCVRHTASEISAISTQAGVHALVRLSDRFGDHGVVGLVMAAVALEDAGVAFLDTFLMSCRVLGRELEGWMLDKALEGLRKLGVEYLLAEYIPSDRNRMVQHVFEERGFTPLAAVPESLSHRLRRAAIAWSPTGVLFVANCNTHQVPGMEIFKPDA